MSALERLTAKRTWFVHDLAVWGTPGSGEICFVAAEGPSASGHLYYGTAEIGGNLQTVEFSQLTDHRGNQLPSLISSPRVLIRPRSTTPVFLIGRETNTSFQIARDPNSPSPVMADLIIIEMGD